MNWNIIKIIILSFTLTSCSGGKDQTNIEMAQGMMKQESIKSQDYDEKQPNRAMMMNPPEGTIPRGRDIYTYDDVAEAERKSKNPFKGNRSSEHKALGKKYFEIYCAVCHGKTAEGNGTVAKAMPIKPPSLLTAKASNYSDAKLFHIVSRGQGVMGSYASQVPNHKHRWAIVNYVRSLQESRGQ